MKCLFLLFTIVSTLVNAKYNFLVARQQDTESCADQGYKDCGLGCIPTSWSCCRDRETTCPPGSYCDLASNNVYGCCRNGRKCEGPANPATRTVPLPEKTRNPDASQEPAPTTERGLDETTAVEDDFGPTAVEEPIPTTRHQSKGTGSADSNAGASNQLDNTISYILAGVIALLV